MKCQNCKKLECTQPYQLCEKATHDAHLSDLEKKLKESVARNVLYRDALETLRNCHFTAYSPQDPIPKNSFWTASREAFALLDEKYIQQKLKK